MEFKVSPEENRLAAQNCRDTAAREDGYLGELRSYVTALMGEYQGSAAQAFQALMTQYDRNSERLTNALICHRSWLGRHRVELRRDRAWQPP
jgi:WXG100 family type VII secretion target